MKNKTHKVKTDDGNGIDNFCAPATLAGMDANKWHGSFGLGLVLAVLTAGTVTCNATTGSATRVRIVTSFYPVYIATLNVAGDVPGVEVVNLTKPLIGCLHDYQMTPDDLVSLSKADIFVVNGAGMETFLDKAIQQVPRLKLIQSSDGIALMSTAGIVNPHVWVSVTAHMQQVENIAAGLARFDPDHAALYRTNATTYLAKLDALRAAMHAGLQNAMTRDIITFHEAFPYFAREFGLTVVAVIEREPGSEPNARELAQAITLVKKTGVKAIFAEPQYSAKAADAIARETGATVYCLDPVVTGPMAPDAYLTIMKANLQTLEQALGHQTTDNGRQTTE
ncbi:MAG: metal ABC transporter substrate-binding protein [Kiritimatiellaeota bacterium]|nr:metal ABC transporter substrate-binding protein [Kiritimatiellota bacterium]